MRRLRARVSRQTRLTRWPGLTRGAGVAQIASHNASRPRLLRLSGLMDALVHVVRAAEPGSRPLRGALVTLTNLSCHKAPPRPHPPLLVLSGHAASFTPY
jgi:hypothetical protein